MAMPREVDEIVRRGRLLITPTRVALPPVCVKTGSSDDLVEKQWNLTWYPPLILLALLLPFGLLVVLVLYVVLRKKGELRFHIRREFVARRRNWVLGGFCIFLAGIGVCYWFAEQEQFNLFLVGVAIILFSLIVMVVGGRTLWPARITATHMHLKGCGEPFLSQFQAVQ
ncbi:MAG: hypothetical protein AAF663_12545 [Planctomycetota bacterium]